MSFNKKLVDEVRLKRESKPDKVHFIRRNKVVSAPHKNSHLSVELNGTFCVQFYHELHIIIILTFITSRIHTSILSLGCFYII